MISLKDTDHLPDQPGIYIFKENDIPIYIGKSVNLRARVKSHVHQAALIYKEKAIVTQADSLEFITTLSNFDALVLEAKMIRTHKPKYNVVWKDDKNYLYIKITQKSRLPRLLPVRKENDGKSLYFGPFKSSHMTQKLMYEVRRIVPFATHEAKAGRACFYAKLGFCNPCPNTILSEQDPIKRKERMTLYRKNIRRVISILSGNTKEFTHSLETQLKTFSEEQKYEEAIKIRNKLFQFSLFLDRRTFDEHTHGVDVDMTKLEGEIDEFLLKHFNHTTQPQRRIECYDISNLFGKATTGSMVVFQDGIIARKEYKKFALKRKGISDIHMMEEVLSRRLLHEDWTKPDLIILDGGSPQLRMIDTFFRKNNITIPLISIAKRPDRILMAQNGYRPIGIDRSSLLFRLFQSLRDESHRFAKKYHVTLRNRNLLE